MRGSAPLPLAGVRVLLVADYVFVPAAAAVLTGWGADVVKIEHHEHGDLMRGLRTFHPGAMTAHVPTDYNPVMEGASRGSRSIGLNLAHPRGRDVLHRLAARADVFMTSKLESTRKKLAFDVEDLRAVNSSLIYARGSGRGTRGPEASAGGFDSLDFWYRSGIAVSAMAREAAKPPFLPGGAAMGDLTSAMNLAGGIATALFHRAMTGEALVVDVSLLASAVWSAGGAITQSVLYGLPAGQPDAGEAVQPLVNTYRTSDGQWIAFACMQASKYWAEFCAVLERDDLAADERFQSQAGLEAHAMELADVIASEIARRPSSHWHPRFRRFSGQWGPVHDSLTITRDEQVDANQYLEESSSSTGEPLVFARPPVQFNGQPVETRPAPAFNADGDTILEELGMTVDEILELRIDGAMA